MSSTNSTNMVGTPSKHKTALSFFGRTSSKVASSSSSSSSQSSAACCKIGRYILLGFGIGAATMALFQSVNLPRIRVELEYEDAPVEVQQRRHKQAFIIGSKSNQNDRREIIEDPDADNTVPMADVAATGEAKKKHGKKGKSSKHTHKTDTGMTIVEQEMEHEEDDPDFSNPGPPPKLDPEEAFAACILIKDDNHWLIEWLAYHYHTMPLRYLIVAVDPDSKTSPIPILKRYKDKKLMTISIWNDKMFMPKKIKAKATMFNNNTGLMEHRVRQNNFYFKCMRTFKQRNREWLMLIDTDEYIVTNYASGLYYNITKNIPISKPGNVLTFIKQHHQLTGENHTCSYMPRYMFGVKESDNAVVQKHMPPSLDGRDLLTQRFLYRNPRRMHNGKNLINIRKLPQIKTYTSVHHVSSYCPDPDKMRQVNHVKKALVRVHHYLGTPEQYFFRSDPRMASGNTNNNGTATNGTGSLGPTKTAKNNGTATTAYFTRGKGRFEMLNKRAVYPDHGARAWIGGFIKDVGLETAKFLLEGVGQVDYSPIVATGEEEKEDAPKEEVTEEQQVSEASSDGKPEEPVEDPPTKDKKQPSEDLPKEKTTEKGQSGDKAKDGDEQKVVEEPAEDEKEKLSGDPLKEHAKEGQSDNSPNKGDDPTEEKRDHPSKEHDNEEPKEDPTEGKPDDSLKETKEDDKEGEEGENPGNVPLKDAVKETDETQ